MKKIIMMVLISWCFGNVVHAETAENWQLPLTGKVIVIDPGHGGNDGGATREDVVEKHIALAIAKRVRNYLQPHGALVILTREGDYDLADKGVRNRKAIDLSRRVKIIRSYNPDLFISIHLNAIPHASSRGAQTFYYPSGSENKKVAESIQSELIRCLNNTSRLAKPIAHVYLLKHVQVPSALVEVGFVTNSNERVLLKRENYQEKIATSIYRGVLHYFNEKKQEN